MSKKSKPMTRRKPAPTVRRSPFLSKPMTRAQLEELLRMTVAVAVIKRGLPRTAAAGALAQIAVETLERAGYGGPEIDLWLKTQGDNVRARVSLNG